MYRDPQLDWQVASAALAQRESIRRWERSGFAAEDTYGPRLAVVLASALQLDFYRSRHGEKAADLLAGASLNPAWTYRDVLRGLPVIDKADARQIGQDAMSSRQPSFANYFETSGTTSRPMPAPKTPTDLAVNTVNFAEHWVNIVRPGDAALILINTPQGPAAFQFEQVLNYLGALTFRTWVDTYRNDYGRVVEILQTFRANVFAGPPSQLLNLYEHSYASNSVRPEFRTSLVTGERTTAGMRRRLESLTGGVVIDASYGSSETGTIAVAVGPGRLRLQSQSFIVEVRDPRTGEIRFAADCDELVGELIITQLDQPARPLIRYATGDLVRIVREASGEQILTPLGRSRDRVDFGELFMDQERLEELIWPADRPLHVLNYLLVIDQRGPALLATADDASDAEVLDQLRPIRMAIPSLQTLRVAELPATSGLGSALGWKATRILDLTRPGPRDLPPALAAALDLAIDAARRELNEPAGARA